MEKQGIEVFVGGLIKDLQDIGEHTGVINFKNGNVEIKPAQANGKFNEHKEALKRLRQKKAAHQDRTILRNFLRERHDTADFFVDTLAELAEKNPGLGNYWADIFEAYVDAAGKFGECGDITYHFHPTPNPLSSVDLRTASINNFLPLALAYDNGGIMAFYLEKGKHKNKRFPVKDPEKKFQLDLLSSKVYAKKDFVLFNKKTKITQHTDCFGDALHYLKRAVEQYSAEAAAGKKDPKKEKQLGETVDFLNNNLIRKFKYLSETSKELWDSKGHQEAVGRYNAYAQELKGLLHAYKGAAPEKPKEKGQTQPGMPPGGMGGGMGGMGGMPGGMGMM